MGESAHPWASHSLSGLLASHPLPGGIPTRPKASSLTERLQTLMQTGASNEGHAKLGDNWNTLVHQKARLLEQNLGNFRPPPPRPQRPHGIFEALSQRPQMPAGPPPLGMTAIPRPRGPRPPSRPPPGWVRAAYSQGAAHPGALP